MEVSYIHVCNVSPGSRTEFTQRGRPGVAAAIAAPGDGRLDERLGHQLQRRAGRVHELGAVLLVDRRDDERGIGELRDGGCATGLRERGDRQDRGAAVVRRAHHGERRVVSAGPRNDEAHGVGPSWRAAIRCAGASAFAPHPQRTSAEAGFTYALPSRHVTTAFYGVALALVHNYGYDLTEC
jgi:hypothetical protein